MTGTPESVEMDRRPADGPVGGLAHGAHESGLEAACASAPRQAAQVRLEIAAARASKRAVASTRHSCPASASHFIRMRMLCAAPLSVSV